MSGTSGERRASPRHGKIVGQDETREFRIVFLVNDAERQRIDELATRAGLARGTYIRHRLLYAERR